MIEYSQFFPYVLPYCPDASEPQALHAIRSAVIEFCERTTIWRQRGVLVTSDGQGQYPIPVPLDSRIAVTLAVAYETNSLTSITDESALSAFGSGFPRKFVSAGNSVELYPLPDGEYELDYIVALAPTRDSLEVGNDSIFEEYAEAIAAGALGMLYMTMGQPYYNQSLGTSYQSTFRTMANKALSEIRSGGGRGRLQVSLNPFARGARPWR